jgi:hypothetical protein
MLGGSSTTLDHNADDRKHGLGIMGKLLHTDPLPESVTR